MEKDTRNLTDKHKRRKKLRYPTCSEWIQLLVTFSVPVAIALYTIVQNNHDQTIALANREKDLEIARNQRAQDLQIADDQQKANILAAYESFLVDHLNRYGMTLDENTSARFVARFKTLTTVNQLDRTRKTYLIRSLFEAKLIVNNNDIHNLISSSIISLEEADLSEISLESRSLQHLSLPKTNLTRAIFAAADLSYANFYGAILTGADLNHASVSRVKTDWYPKPDRTYHTIFAAAKMNGANLSQGTFVTTNFSSAILDYVNMRHFFCRNCLFFATTMYQADLSFSVMTTDSKFQWANLTEAVLVSAWFNSTIFNSAICNRIQATSAKFEKCSFTLINFDNCTLEQTLFIQSNLTKTSFNDVNLSKSILENVTFMNISMRNTDLSSTLFRQCTFINVDFSGAVVRNVSFLNCIFQQSLISNEQRFEAASFNGSTFA